MEQRYQEAEQLYKRSLEIRDTEDAASLRNLALVEVGLKNDRDAAADYKRMVAIPVSDAAPALREYAEVLRRMHRPAEAAVVEKKAKAAESKPQMNADERK
jgi:tetratricopeptide (TPR) repeat protein